MQLIVQVVNHFPIIKNPLVTPCQFNFYSIAGSPEISRRHVYSYGNFVTFKFIPFLSCLSQLSRKQANRATVSITSQ